MRASLLVTIGSLLFIQPLVSGADTVAYHFTQIAPITGQSLSPPAMNNRGIVAFTDRSGVFTGNGGPLTSIVSPFSSPTSASGNASINDSGTVAFGSSAAQGIYTGSGGPLKQISPEFNGGDPSINDAGRVAYFGRNSVLTSNGGPTRTIATAGGSLRYFIGGAPAINNAGTVAFLAGLERGIGLFTGSGGPLTAISTQISGVNVFPSINDAGIVAFSASLTTGADGIFTGTGSSLTTIADSSGPFRDFGTASINRQGVVAFSAFLDAGGEGIFTGPSPTSDGVVSTGDPLFGSTASTFSIGPEGVNDAGQVAFSVVLANGRIVVARADPIPEPTTFTMAASGALILLLCASARRRLLSTPSARLLAHLFSVTLLLETLARQRQAEIEKHIRQTAQIRNASLRRSFAPLNARWKMGVASFSLLSLLALIVLAYIR